MTTQTDPVATAIEPLDGRGPGGMWWVAWRLHRGLLIGWAILVVASSAALVVIRLAMLDHGAGSVCVVAPFYADDPSCPNDFRALMYTDFGWWPTLQVVLASLPAVVGLVGGTALLATELERGTSILALSQSVTRRRWLTVKSIVVGAPVVAGSVIVGSLSALVRDVFGPFGEPWQDAHQLGTSGLMSAAVALLCLSVGTVGGSLIRSVLPTLVVGLTASVVLIIGLITAAPYLVAAQRDVVAVDSSTAPPILYDNIWFLDSGWLDVNGREVGIESCSYLERPSSTHDSDLERCYRDEKIVSRYTDYLSPDRVSELRATIAFMCAGLSALFLAAGAFVLRRRAL